MVKELCPHQEVCPDYSNGSKRRVHHIRATEKCLVWKFKRCVKLGDACEIAKIKRIKETI